jgi:hypothetical protein
MGSFRNDMRDLVVDLFEDETLDPKLNHIKFHVFGKPAGGAIVVSSHPTVTMQVCFALDQRCTDPLGFKPSFRHSDITALIRQECIRDGDQASIC